VNSNDPDDVLPSLDNAPNGLETVTLDLDFSDQAEIGEALLRILNSRRDEIEGLCGEFLDDYRGRLSLDDESFEVESVSLEDGNWVASCNFTVSAYYGCRDMNIDADERSCSIALAIDLGAQKIVLKVPRRKERDTFEEF